MPNRHVHVARLRRLAFLVAVGAALVACSPEPPVLRPDGGGPRRYVALGDSSVAGPLTGPMVGPFGCFRSSTNFPHLLADAIGVRELVDVSCGNAVLADLSRPQQLVQFGIPLGTAPAQLDALTPETDLVTIAMTGNDVGLPDVVLGCINLVLVPLGPPPFGQSCIPTFVRDGIDTFSTRIDEVGPRYADALAGIRRRAPKARILVLGYIGPMPQGDDGCFPRVPGLPEDIAYVRSKLEEMNEMIRDAATAAGVEYVDVYGPSIGHDICQDGATRWFNAFEFDSPGFVAHMNALGHRETARIVAQALGSRPPAPAIAR